MESQKRGRHCEDMVCHYLEQKGHKIVSRNFCTRYGEIDILSAKDGTLCVVEVKSMSPSWDDDQIQFKVGPQKRLRMKRALEIFLEDSDVIYRRIRFDVAAVKGNAVLYYEDAF